jgi:prevent-host-death family protein
MQITISAEELESRCDELLDQVAAEGLTVVVTKDGRPVAKLMPVPVEAELFGAMRGSGIVKGDIISPIEGVWELKERADPNEIG